MPDDARLIEDCEIDIWATIDKMHRGGVRYEIVHNILKEMVETLEAQSYVENWLDKFAK